jgi:hypothetical protein
VAGSIVEGAAQSSVRSVSVGIASHCLAGTTGEGASLASVFSVGVDTAIDCYCENDR